MTKKIDSTLRRVNWHRDPAASGWRSRAFFKNPPGEILAYDDGVWSVYLGETLDVSGQEADAEKAKTRALLVYKTLLPVHKALTRSLT